MIEISRLLQARVYSWLETPDLFSLLPIHDHFKLLSVCHRLLHTLTFYPVPRVSVYSNRSIGPVVHPSLAAQHDWVAFEKVVLPEGMVLLLLLLLLLLVALFD